MSFVVFVGPSLSRESARQVLDATYLPPASQGDVYLAARQKPWGIGIIDGYFKHAPAVWHKEILWALAKGVHVFGAASMGALRAAELAPFGMVGIGNIFDDFRTGKLQDDDEVTILHSDAEAHYLPLSDAMVNIRATLQAATADNIITVGEQQQLTHLAKQDFYEDRSFTRLFESANDIDISDKSLNALQAWLPNHQLDLKRADALLMLNTMRDHHHQHPEPVQVSFRFQHTDAWEQVRSQIQHKRLTDDTSSATQQGDAILSELKLQGHEYLSIRENTLVHLLCQELAEGTGASVDAKLIPDSLEKFRIRQGLTAPESVEPWLDAQSLDIPNLLRLLKEALTTSRYRSLLDSELEQSLVEQMKLSGTYQTLQQRSEEKQSLLASQGLHNPVLGDAKLSEQALWSWYFCTHLQQKEASNPSEFAQTMGFRDTATLRREVLREYLYQSLISVANG